MLPQRTVTDTVGDRVRPAASDTQLEPFTNPQPLGITHPEPGRDAARTLPHHGGLDRRRPEEGQDQAQRRVLRQEEEVS